MIFELDGAVYAAEHVIVEYDFAFLAAADVEGAFFGGEGEDDVVGESVEDFDVEHVAGLVVLESQGEHDVVLADVDEELVFDFGPARDFDEGAEAVAEVLDVVLQVVAVEADLEVLSVEPPVDDVFLRRNDVIHFGLALKKYFTFSSLSSSKPKNATPSLAFRLPCSSPVGPTRRISPSGSVELITSITSVWDLTSIRFGSFFAESNMFVSVSSFFSGKRFRLCTSSMFSFSVIIFPLRFFSVFSSLFFSFTFMFLQH